MGSLTIGTASIGIIVFVIVALFETLQTEPISEDQFAFDIEESKSTSNGKYIQFNQCTDEQIYSQMISSAYFIRKYLNFDRKILSKQLLKETKIEKNKEICKYFECNE